MDEDITDPFDVFVRSASLFGLENSAIQRYYSKYPGVVTDNNDPDQLGRVRVKVESLGFDERFEAWAFPSTPYAGYQEGFYFPPEPGTNVWVWFDHGDINQPHYSGCWWPSKSGAVPAVFKQGGVKGLVTNNGVLLFEDKFAWDGTTIRDSVVLATTQESQSVARRHALELVHEKDNDRVVLRSEKGHKLELNDTVRYLGLLTPGERGLQASDNNDMVLLKNGALARLEFFQGQSQLVATGEQILQSQSLKALTTAEMTFEAAGGLITMSSLAGIMLTGASVSLVSAAVGGIILGSVGLALRLVTEALIAVFNANVAIYGSHTHTVTTAGAGNLGAPVVSTGTTSPPLAPMAPADLDSVTTVTTKAS